MRLTLVVSALCFLGFTWVELRGRSRAIEEIPSLPASPLRDESKAGPGLPIDRPAVEPVRPVAAGEPTLSAEGPAVTVIDCAAGEIVFRPRGPRGGNRSIPLRRTEGVAAAQVPLLWQAERLRAAGDRAAEALYRQTADAADAGRAPGWAGAVASARLMDLATDRGDFPSAADRWLALAALRPRGSEGFLPAALDCREPEPHDAAVRKLHREVFAALCDGRDPAPALAMLDRMRFVTPDPAAPFDRLPAHGEPVVWVLDAASLPTDVRATAAAQISSAIWRLGRSGGRRFAVVAGPGALWCFPAAGGTAQPEFAAKQAAARFLAELGDGIRADWPETVRTAAAMHPGATLILVTCRRDSAVPAGVRTIIANPAVIR